MFPYESNEEAMSSVGIQDDVGPCEFVGGTKFAAGSGVVDSEWNCDDEEEAIRIIDLNSALRSGDGVSSGSRVAKCSYS